MLLRWLLTVLTEMNSMAAISVVSSISAAWRSTSSSRLLSGSSMTGTSGLVPGPWAGSLAELNRPGPRGVRQPQRGGRGRGVTGRGARRCLGDVGPPLEPVGERPALPGLAHDLHGAVRVALAQGLACRDDAGNRPDHPVRVQPQRGFRPFQLAVRLAQLVPLDMDGGQGDVSGGA